MFWFWVLSLLLGCTSFIQHRIDRLRFPEPVKPDSSSFRNLASGPVVGLQSGESVHVWRGIPYAKPPVGNLRWKAPRPVKPWTQPLHALHDKGMCTQYPSTLGRLKVQRGRLMVGGEDCLYLNVWAPRFPEKGVLSGHEKLPVMVWIHGGGNRIGSGGIYHGAELVKNEQIILVTVNYRLGPFGWFRHPALTQAAENPEDASGNFGTLDLIAALQWVQQNISGFGGDPDNVTIFGESAGGRNVLSLLVSPLSKGLFHRAISQSGLVSMATQQLAENTVDDGGHVLSSTETLARIIQNKGLAKSREGALLYLEQQPVATIQQLLYALSADELLAAQPLSFGLMARFPQNIRDGRVLPNMSFYEALSQPQLVHPVPVMVGANRDEQKFFLMQSKMIRIRGPFVRAKNRTMYELAAEYHSDLWQAEAVDEVARRLHALRPNSVWAYRFDWDDLPKNIFADLPFLLGAGHGLELPFLFGFQSGLSIPLLYSRRTRQERLSLSHAMQSRWAAFAKTGQPNVTAAVEWLPWGRDGYTKILFDAVSDGGVRMSKEALAVKSIFQKLSLDERFPNEQKRKKYRQSLAKDRDYIQINKAGKLQLFLD